MKISPPPLPSSPRRGEAAKKLPRTTGTMGGADGARPLPPRPSRPGDAGQAAGPGLGKTGPDPEAPHFATHGATSQRLAAPLTVSMAQETSLTLSILSAAAGS